MIRYISGAAALVAAVVAAAVVLSPGATGSVSPAPPRLLSMYQPVVHLDPAEHFAPTSVQTFIADSTLERFDGTGWVVSDPDPGPGNLPGPGTGTWRLNQQPCSPTLPLGGLDCYTSSWSDDAGSSVVYGRVTHQSGETILQYWFFYYDDVYSVLYPPADVLWQAHEGDWEVVNVVLDGNEQPLFVGYSQHCAGQKRAWAQTPTWAGTHPVVYVAAGSHANYFDLGLQGFHQLQSQCVPPAVLQALGSLPYDHTGGGMVAGPPLSGGIVTHVSQIDGSIPSWSAFPGFWGETEYFHGPPPIGTVPAGYGPAGPAYHAVWSDPLGTLALWPSG